MECRPSAALRNGATCSRRSKSRCRPSLPTKSGDTSRPSKPSKKREVSFPMDLNRYTEKAREAVLATQQLADRAGHSELLPEHLLLALLEQPDGIVPAVLAMM